MKPVEIDITEHVEKAVEESWSGAKLILFAAADGPVLACVAGGGWPQRMWSFAQAVDDLRASLGSQAHVDRWVAVRDLKAWEETLQVALMDVQKALAAWE